MKFDFLDLTQRLETAHTKRIALRPVSLVDAWPLFEATRNDQFNRYLLWPQPRDEHELLLRFRLIADQARQGRLTAMSAVLRRTGELISLFRFLPHSIKPRCIEMGIWTHDRFWHGRYSLELGRLCVSAAFSLSEVEVLLGASAPENRGSCSLMTAVGMRPTDLVARPTEMGTELVLQEFEITRDEWLSSHVTAFDTFDPESGLAYAPPLLPVHTTEDHSEMELG